MNLIDCINNSAPLATYLFYVGTMFMVSILLMFVQSNFVIVAVLTFVGSMSLFDIQEPNRLTAGVMFLLFALRMSHSKVFNILVYIFVFIAVTTAHVFHGLSPADFANSITAYAVLCALDVLILKGGEK